jgi:CTP synthase
VHGGIANKVGVSIEWISSDRFTDRDVAAALLEPFDGLLVPGGFGVRGVEGMVTAIEAARARPMPFFGICLGMQVAIIEFARNVCGIADANSSEFAPECGNPVISLLPSQRNVEDLGGTMRLGAYACKLRAGSLVAKIYGAGETSERHRHRYEVDNGYRDIFAEHGLRLTGLSPDGSLVEMIELPDHPWYVACQFHPELKSRPTRPHPLFAGFIAAARDYQQRRGAPAESPARLAQV